MALEPYRCETSAVVQVGRRRTTKVRGEGDDDDDDDDIRAEEGEGERWGGIVEEDEPTPLDYLVDPHYGESS
jgi:hypothetical protein